MRKALARIGRTTGAVAATVSFGLVLGYYAARSWSGIVGRLT